MMEYKKVLIIVFGVILIAGAGYFAWNNFYRLPEVGPACTMEAKICPDGTAVGRSGPNCEFAECPVFSGNPKNATYNIEGVAVTLTNGVSEKEAAPGSASKIITRYFGNEAMGDIDGDGAGDKAFLLTQQRGGSGMFYYAAAVVSGKNYAGTNAIFLGDRIAPQSTQITNGEIVVNYAERKPGEPMTTQPSVGVTKYIQFINGKLVSKINSFEECAGAGYPIMESFPERCKTPDGRTFTRKIVQESGISGSVLLGPTCPVVREPPEQGCADRPFETKFDAATPDGSRVVKQFSSDAEGKFKVILPPGDYVIRKTASGSFLPRCSEEAVKVSAGKFTELNISCDTGIR